MFSDITNLRSKLRSLRDGGLNRFLDSAMLRIASLGMTTGCAQNDKNNGFPLRLKPDLRFRGNDKLFVRAVSIMLAAFFIDMGLI